MEERLLFVQDVHRPGWSIAELCRRYQVSRKTGYKWLAAYGRAGPAGLVDGSHRPCSFPQATPPTMVELILKLQRRYTWGARKVRKLLLDRVPADQVPTKTTVHRILERNGRVKPRRRARRRFHAGPPGTPMDQPNAVWTADFKGQFRTGNGIYCYPGSAGSTRLSAASSINSGAPLAAAATTTKEGPKCYQSAEYKVLPITWTVHRLQIRGKQA